MNFANILFQVWVAFVIIATFYALVWYPLWYFLHRWLSNQLDPLLLKEPYFTRAEQFNYQFFPLYLVKAINYIYLVAWPTMAKKKRFKGLDQELPIGPALRVTCVVHFSLMCVGALIFLLWMAMAAYTLLYL